MANPDRISDDPDAPPAAEKGCCDPRETLETFLGDALNRPPPSPEEMTELREMAKTDPAVAAALSLSECGGLDVQAILDIRNAEFEDYEISGDHIPT